MPSAPAAQLGAASDAMPASCQLAVRPVGMTKPQQVPIAQPATLDQRARVARLAPERFGLQVTIARETHDKLRHAQELLGHALPAGDIGKALDRVLDALIEQLDRQMFSASVRSQAASRRHSGNPRDVPAAIRREVWRRGDGMCTFLNKAGYRCDARMRREHVLSVARRPDDRRELAPALPPAQPARRRDRVRRRLHGPPASRCADPRREEI